jgi:hypothetical protein
MNSWFDTNTCDSKDYVYEKRAGDGIVVYVVDFGVQVDVKNVGCSSLIAKTPY